MTTPPKRPRAWNSSLPAPSKPMAKGAGPTRSGRIKPKKRSAKEFKRIYGSVARVQWIAARPCVGCGGGPCEGHHIVGEGMARKAHHSLVVPLCEHCHDELHDHGKLTFELAHRVCLAVEAERTHKAWYEYVRVRQARTWRGIRGRLVEADRMTPRPVDRARLVVAVFEERQRVAHAEGFGEGEKYRRVDALDRRPAQHPMRAGLRDARRLRQRVRRRHAVARHVGLDLPIDHGCEVYAYYSCLTSTQRTLSILPVHQRGDEMSELPKRTADTMSDAIAMSSPNGRMSKRAHKRACDALAVALFGPDGGTREQICGKSPTRPKQVELRAHAARLRDLAAGGMCVRKYTRLANEAEAEADALDAASLTSGEDR